MQMSGFFVTKIFLLRISSAWKLMFIVQYVLWQVWINWKFKIKQFLYLLHPKVSNGSFIGVDSFSITSQPIFPSNTKGKNIWFLDDLRGSNMSLIDWNSLNINTEIWTRFFNKAYNNPVKHLRWKSLFARIDNGWKS